MPAEVSYRVVRPSALTPQELAKWQSCLDTNPMLSSPFFSPAYASAVGEIVDTLFVGIAERAGEAFAFLPFERSEANIGKRLHLCDYQAVICRPDESVDMVAFIRGCGLKAWDFDHLVATQLFLRPFHQKQSLSRTIHLKDGYANYVTERRAAGTEQIKKSGNLMRRIEREVGPLRLEAHVPDVELLKQLLHWRAAKYPDSRHPMELLVALTSRLLRENNPDCSGALSVLYAGDEVVACHFGLRSARTWHYWFPAYNPQFEKYSPGNILLLKIAELAPSLGIQVIDLGKGEQEYKKRFANDSIELAEGSVDVAPVLSLARSVKRSLRSYLRGDSASEGISNAADEAPATPR